MRKRKKKVPSAEGEEEKISKEEEDGREGRERRKCQMRKTK